MSGSWSGGMVHSLVRGHCIFREQWEATDGFSVKGRLQPMFLKDLSGSSREKGLQ